MFHGPTIVILGKYFDKRQGIANGFGNSGSAFGGLVFPPIITVVLNEFGLWGALISVSGILLNGLVVGALLRPIEFYTKSRIRTESSHSANKRRWTDNSFVTRNPYLKIEYQYSPVRIL
jgi:MFS family permease